MTPDIDPRDGYILTARGDLSKADETYIPAPPSEIEVNKWERPVRFGSGRRPMQARRYSLNKSQQYRLGSISPTVRALPPLIPGAVWC